MRLIELHCTSHICHSQMPLQPALRLALHGQNYHWKMATRCCILQARNLPQFRRGIITCALIASTALTVGKFLSPVKQL